MKTKTNSALDSLSRQQRSAAHFSIGEEYGLQFSITENMVHTFARLTGDTSSLHTNPSFGRKSPYRTNVVHGFLPLCWILALPFSKASGYRFQSISAAFLKPILSSRPLELKVHVRKSESAEGKISFDFSVIDVSADILLISGAFTLILKEGSYISNCPERISASLLLTPLTESELVWGQISKHDQKEFDLVPDLSLAKMLHEILTQGTSQHFSSNFPDWVQKWQLTDFLASLTFSTFAGMCLPGRFATILSVQIDFSGEVKPSQIHTLSGEVVFKSSAECIVENLTIKEKGNSKILISGKMNVKVGKAPPIMPSVQELKKSVSNLDLKNKVVVVTGASRGIGETTAKLFALHGSKVVINYLSGEEDARAIVKEIENAGAQAMAFQADVSNEKEVQEMIEATRERFGGVDILVNNAVRDAIPIPFESLTWDDMQKDIDITIKGAFNCCKSVIPSMIQKGGGKIINLSTVYVKNPPPHQSKYVVSKSGLEGLTRSLSVELASRNIQVNLVVPSVVETDLSSGMSPLSLQAVIQNSPAKRLIMPVEVAQAIVSLSSSSDLRTGEEIAVAGTDVF